MAQFGIRFDFRCPDICPVSPAELYHAALQQCEWADSLGFGSVVLSEHHGSDDGYLPSLVPLASAIAARTSKMGIRLGAVIAPLHNPLRLAEDLSVLDHLSRGRLEVVLANGYVPSEFQMFDVQLSDRVKLVTETVETLKQAWTAQPFEFRGRKVRVTPAPFRQPRPPIILGGASEGAARRAAQIADGFMPTMPQFWDFYRDELKQLGKEDPGSLPPISGMYFHVTKDVEETWEQVGPHALHEMNGYGKWASESGSETGYQPMEDLSVLRSLGMHQIVTPSEAIEIIKNLPEEGQVMFHPLMGGLNPDLAWQNLKTFETEVLPHI